MLTFAYGPGGDGLARARLPLVRRRTWSSLGIALRARLRVPVSVVVDKAGLWPRTRGRCRQEARNSRSRAFRYPDGVFRPFSPVPCLSCGAPAAFRGALVPARSGLTGRQALASGPAGQGNFGCAAGLVGFL